jgi:hypothetical protein
MDDPSNDLLLQEFYRRGTRRRDYMCLGCGSFITLLTLWNALTIGTVYYVYQDYTNNCIDGYEEIAEGTFLKNETAVKHILHQIPKLIDHLCKEFGC